MNKLGFVIKVVSDGVYEPLVCNEDSWFQKVIDPRHYLRMFSGLIGTENVVTAMSFSEYGCYIMLLRDIPGHAGDCLSVWLFIPCEVDIDDRQVMEAYNYAKRVLAQSSIKAIQNEVCDFFDKEYPVKSYYSQYAPSVGEKLGLRFVNGEGELSELLGKKRYQEYYSQFKAVFILDRNAEIKVNAEGALSFGDLTKQPLEEYCVLMPPAERELSEMGIGTKVIFQNGKTFESPKYVKKGNEVKLSARRNGFEDVALKTVMVCEDVMPFPNVAHLTWRKVINKAFFDIRNNDGKEVEVEKLIVAGQDITHQQVSLPEEECRHAKVQISAYEYQPWENTVDLLSLREKLIVKLHRAEKMKNYVVVLANGREADMTLKSKYFNGLSGSPLEGYSLDDKKQTLCTSLGYKIKYWFYGVLTVIGAIVAFSVYSALDTWSASHKFKWGLPPWEEVKSRAEENMDNDSTENSEDSDSVAAAIAYLNRNEKWEKDSLEKYSATKELYEQLNNYQFEKLMNDQNIDSCNIYCQIKKVAEEAYSIKLSMSNKYTDDGTITIKSWIEKVNNKIKAKNEDLPNGQTMSSPKRRENHDGGDQQKEFTDPKMNKRGNTGGTDGRNENL